MSELATIARPYARAVFKRARESGTMDKWSEMLILLAAIAGADEMADISDNPNVNKDRLIQIILDVAQGKINTEGSNFLKLLVQNGRLLALPEVSRLYEQYKAESEGYVDVELRTAYSLTKDEEKKLETTLEKKFKKKVHINTSVDRSLIGGIFVRAGDHVIDGSIKGQLQQLAKQL